MVVPLRHRVPIRPVSMPHMLMPTLGRIEILPHQRPALAVAHYLPVAQAVAPADRLARGMRGRMMPMRDSVMRMPGSMRADVDPAMRRTRGEHRWEGRRCLGHVLRLSRRRRRRFGRGLLHRREWLIGDGLLRSQGARQNPERESYANNDGTAHDHLHVSAWSLVTGGSGTR
jgi:hypothetical protein